MEKNCSFLRLTLLVFIADIFHLSANKFLIKLEHHSASKNGHKYLFLQFTINQNTANKRCLIKKYPISYNVEYFGES